MLGRRLPWEGPWLNTENTLLLAECITIPNFVALQFIPNIVALGRTVHSSGVGKGSQKCWDAGAPPPMGRAVATTENTLLLAECITIPNFVALGQTVWS